MAWEWKSHLGPAWVLGFVCVCTRVCPCYTFTISAILGNIPYMIAWGERLVEGADWWDACCQHGRTLGKYKGCILKADFYCCRHLFLLFCMSMHNPLKRNNLFLPHKKVGSVTIQLKIDMCMCVYLCLANANIIPKQVSIRRVQLWASQAQGHPFSRGVLAYR